MSGLQARRGQGRLARAASGRERYARSLKQLPHSDNSILIQNPQKKCARKNEESSNLVLNSGAKMTCRDPTISGRTGMVGYSDHHLTYMGVLFPPKDIQKPLGEVAASPRMLIALPHCSDNALY